MRRRAIAAVCAAGLGLGLGGCETGDLADALSASEAGEGSRARVVRVVDGDTIVVSIGGRERSVRLKGIDTPETVRPGYPVERCGREASAKMGRMAAPGDRVKLVRDSGGEAKDRYGRLLRYVVEGGRDLSRAQLRAGLAEVYRFGGERFDRLRSYRRAAAKARADGRGLYGGGCEGQGG